MGKLYILIIALFFLIQNVAAQNLEQFDKKNPVKIKGSAGVTQTFYNMDGIASRRDPYFWMVNANLNINLFNVIQVPLSLQISQQNRSFTQPFNQFGLSPKYKWLTVHAGYRSLSLSNFSLAGNVFLGGGVEIAPQNSWVKFTALYGRFQKAIQSNQSSGLVAGQAGYERWGGGGKITIGKSASNALDLVLFKAYDKPNSITEINDDTRLLKPVDNLVLAIATRQAITKKISVDGEYSFSAYTADINAPKVIVDKYTYVDNLFGLYQTKASSQFNKAFLANIVYTEKLYQLKFSYRRIDPEYKSLGCIFLNNDLEDITGTVSWRMFKNKMNFATSLGVQRNNLDNQLFTRLKRVIGSVNWGYNVNQHLSINTSIANYNSSTKTINFVGADSIQYTQGTKSGNFAANYGFGSHALRNTIFLNLSGQDANDNNNNHNVFYNSTLGYNVNYNPITTSGSLSINYSRNENAFAQNSSFGPNVTVTKFFFNRTLRTNIAAAYLSNYRDAKQNGETITLRTNCGYTLKKKHGFSLDVNYLIKNAKIVTDKSFRELRVTLVYNYTF